MKNNKHKFGQSSIYCNSNIDNATTIASLISHMTETNGWHSCDFLFFKKDGQLKILQEFRIRKAPKKLLKKLLK